MVLGWGRAWHSSLAARRHCYRSPVVSKVKRKRKKDKPECLRLRDYLEEEVERKKIRRRVEECARLINERPMEYLMLAGTLFLLMTMPATKPKWLKDVPPVNQKYAGPWRGKGSFGKGFGQQEGHR